MLAPPIAHGAWSMALVLWLPCEFVHNRLHSSLYNPVFLCVDEGTVAHFSTTLNKQNRIAMHVLLSR